ncbi:MAG: hypothetical protein IT559_04635 [Alphaproteobacteria bacterium]|nr:hypothetical protein [Alphaproteobacteria bacterium]
MASPSAFSPNGTTATNVAKLTQPARRVNLSDPPIIGWEAIKSRLEELSKLEAGWDGYRGVPMRFEIGYFAAEIIKNLCDLSTPYMPQIIPGSNGDVQIEWHHSGKSIELHVKAPYDVTAWRNNDAVGEDGEEINLTTDFTAISKWLNEFTGATPANEAAAA